MSGCASHWRKHTAGYCWLVKAADRRNWCFPYFLYCVVTCQMWLVGCCTAVYIISDAYGTVQDYKTPCLNIYNITEETFPFPQLLCYSYLCVFATAQSPSGRRNNPAMRRSRADCSTVGGWQKWCEALPCLHTSASTVFLVLFRFILF